MNRAFSDPQKNIDQCGIQVGQTIADLGVGSGVYALLAAQHLMSTGKVYVVDVQKDLLTRIKNNATRQNVHNIGTVWSDIEKVNGSKLQDSSVDLVLLCNVLFQLEDKRNIIGEVRRILKPGGRVLVVDWTGSFGGIGPKPEQVVPADIVKENFEKANFHLDREFSAGAHHYGLIYKKL